MDAIYVLLTIALLLVTLGMIRLFSRMDAER
jgi:hypothetical protein